MNPTEAESLLTGRLNAIYRPPESPTDDPKACKGRMDTSSNEIPHVLPPSPWRC